MTQGYIVADTNALSYVFNAHTLAGFYGPLLGQHVTIISFQTVLEMRYGAYRADWREGRKGALERFLKPFVVAHASTGLSTRCATILASSARAGRQLEQGDAWIAATALELGLPLVTHNKKHFDFLQDLTIISANAA